MIANLASEFGPWSWWVLGIVLLAAEFILPGVFLFWIGIAAIITGLISLPLWGSAIWPWEVQLLVFAALALVSAYAGQRYMRNSTKETDQPLLNKRSESLVGRTATLHEAIRDGRGRIKIDDTIWVVNGPELPKGAHVRIVEGNGRTLTVEAMD